MRSGQHGFQPAAYSQTSLISAALSASSTAPCLHVADCRPFMPQAGTYLSKQARLETSAEFCALRPTMSITWRPS
jgi:hypothetical protein